MIGYYQEKEELCGRLNVYELSKLKNIVLYQAVSLFPIDVVQVNFL